MTERTFFEYLGIADVERIHSQMLAWIFSNDCRAIDSVQRNEIFQEIFRINNPSNLIDNQTEVKRLDLLFETENSIIAVENKIKSSQHSNQLEGYHEIIEKQFANKTKHYFFLTLIKENSGNDIWKEVSYKEIQKSLSKLILTEGDSHSFILKEYCGFLNKLVTVLNNFESNTKDFDDVFKNGSKTKRDKRDFVFTRDLESNRFISDNQLETILQKSFLNRIALKFESLNPKVLETRGDALIDFIIEENIEYNNNFYTAFVQLQNTTLKFSFAVYGKEYGDSSKEWIKDLIPIFDVFVKNSEFGYKRVNKPTAKAYISMSKYFGKYWHMSDSQLIDIILNEIEMAKKITINLKNELSGN